MKKMLLLMSAAVCIHAVNGMETIKARIEPVDFSDIDTKNSEFISLDKLLGIKEFDTIMEYYSVPEFIQKTLKLEEEPKVIPSGNNKLDVLCTKFLKALLLTNNGDYNCYFFIHELRNNWTHLRELIGGDIKPEDQKPEDTEKPSSIPTKPMSGGHKTSGLGLAWAMTTVKYSTAFFGGVGALAFYQWYRAR